MYKHLMVTTDGSKLSDKAVRVAAKLALALQAKLTVFHVRLEWASEMYSEGFMLGGYTYQSQTDFDRDRTAGADKLLGGAGKIAEAAHIKFTLLHVAAAQPYAAIIAAAGKQRCDCIVMASHGRRGLSALMLGSETQKVLTHSAVPVLVIR